jgi:hypothetical protein
LSAFIAWDNSFSGMAMQSNTIRYLYINTMMLKEKNRKLRDLSI